MPRSDIKSDIRNQLYREGTENAKNYVGLRCNHVPVHVTLEAITCLPLCQIRRSATASPASCSLRTRKHPHCHP